MTNLRLKMKVYTNPETGRRYLAATGVVERGFVYATVMSDKETKGAALSIDEWNDLPYFYFKEDGPAEKPEKMWDAEAGKESK
jgi:hypothetical protein